MTLALQLSDETPSLLEDWTKFISEDLEKDYPNLQGVMV